MVYKNFGRITIDDARINETCDAYFKWKDLNTYIKSTSSRGINMPDAISEPMGCYCLGYLWNRGNEVGDATDPETDSKIEFKATSKFDGDLSSFEPKTVFDNLVFCFILIHLHTTPSTKKRLEFSSRHFLHLQLLLSKLHYFLYK